MVEIQSSIRFAVTRTFETLQGGDTVYKTGLWQSGKVTFFLSNFFFDNQRTVRCAMQWKGEWMGQPRYHGQRAVSISLVL